MSQLTPKQAAYVAESPESVQNTLSRAFLADCSPRAAIKAKCLTCCNFSREEVAGCTVTLCPLHAFRPYQPNKAIA